jgi:hypothetical protein
VRARVLLLLLLPPLLLLPTAQDRNLREPHGPQRRHLRELEVLLQGVVAAASRNQAEGAMQPVLLLPRPVRSQGTLVAARRDLDGNVQDLPENTDDRARLGQEAASQVHSEEVVLPSPNPTAVHGVRAVRALQLVQEPTA